MLTVSVGHLNIRMYAKLKSKNVKKKKLICLATGRLPVLGENPLRFCHFCELFLSQCKGQ